MLIAAQNNLDEKQSCHCGWSKIQDVQQPGSVYSGDPQAESLRWRYILLQGSQWPRDSGDRMQAGGERYVLQELMGRPKLNNSISSLSSMQNSKHIISAVTRMVEGEEV